jgi:hypothetical protein
MLESSGNKNHLGVVFFFQSSIGAAQSNPIVGPAK